MPVPLPLHALSLSPRAATSVLLVLTLLCSCDRARETAGDEDGKPARPNVVFILADDFGITDAQGYEARFTGIDTSGTFHQTPNLNRLMAGGVSFSQAYATQLCSPTRAGILSGKFAPRLGFMTAMPVRETYYNQGLPVPDGYYAHDVLDHHDDIKIQRAWDNATSNSALPTGAPADAGRDILSLAEAMPNHHSAFIGKWHIGGFGAAGHQPADQGFAPLAWFDGGGSAYLNWRKGWNNSDKSKFPDMPQSQLEMGNAGPETGEDYLTDDLTAQALNYLDNRANNPDKEPFFLYFSHFAVHAPYQGKKEEVAHFKNRSTIGANGHKDPVYAAMVKSMDYSVGAILDKLESTGMADNTVVIFMSDNGGIDSKITPRGDGTDNAPFLGGKACLTEGGIRVPLVVYWKNKIAGGQWIDQAVDYTDIYPTILVAAGYEVDQVIEDENLDGRSILPLLSSEFPGSYEKEAKYWHYPFNVIYNSPYDGYPLTPHSAVRVKEHKLIFDWHGRLHLYNIEADPYERNDLADREPELRDALFLRLINWLEKEVDQRYWPVLNKEYEAEEEVREDGFVDLVFRK